MSYPQNEPSNFDLIVIGIGLPESVLAAAAFAAGKSVLHLVPNSFFGSHFASLPLLNFTNFFQAHSLSQSSPAQSQTDASGEFTISPLINRPVYSSVEIGAKSSEVLENSRKFCFDLVGPRVLLCADEIINLIMKTDINQYMEFKSVDASFFCDRGDSNLVNVPDSRSAIFKDNILNFTGKNQLMRFFKLVQGHFGIESGEENKKISDEDLESPFLEFLIRKIGLSQTLKSIILYATVMTDYDQDNKEVQRCS